MGHESTADLRIRDVRPLLPPAILVDELPLSDAAAELVSTARAEIADSLHGGSKRLVVVVGPCSVHDPDGALRFAERLHPLAQRYSKELLVVMRAYFEKPRTTIGWKGLINDPDIDGSFHINKGLRIARRLLSDLADIGLPTGTEFLDLNVPQHIADLVAWGAIGARTAESQIHRELASGLSMPIGFKNATTGDLRVAVDAVETARHPHWFPGATKQGVAAILQTTGNRDCHVILRGGTRTGPNFSREHVQEAAEELTRKGLPERVMVDCSHGNSAKVCERQVEVARDLARQVRDGGSAIFGVMLETNLVAGRQDYVPGTSLTFGQSITDACLSLDDTEPLLEELASAVATS
jgi:3-deoxy-7-phosphoheptulonate synthase